MFTATLQGQTERFGAQAVKDFYHLALPAPALMAAKSITTAKIERHSHDAFRPAVGWNPRLLRQAIA